MHSAFVFLVLVGVAAAGLAPLHRIAENVKGQYIIEFKDDVDVDIAADAIQRNVQKQRLGHASITQRYRKALNGIAAQLSDEAVEYIRTLDEVEAVSEDGIAHAIATPWGIDRVSQRNLPLDNSYSPSSKYSKGSGVTIYILDTGIRYTHNILSGRATYGFDCTGEGTGRDCGGHGTHCAGIAVGTTYGAAQSASVVSVKIFGDSSNPCAGSGSYSVIIQGLDYVINNGRKPGVISMSLGGGASSALDNAVTRAINAGYPVIVAAGNDNSDACYTSPARHSQAVTVGSTESSDARSYFSNYGSCVDIFAPGSSIRSAGISYDSQIVTKSGTSMACPLVAGIAALYLGENPNLSPSQVRSKLISNASSNKVSNPGWNSPNRLAYID